MILAALILSCIIFIEAFLFLELGKQARAILVAARDAVRLLTDGDRSDAEKEAGTRRAAGLILAMTAVVALKLAAIAAALSGVFLGAVLISPASEPGLIAALASPAVIASLTVAAGCYVWMRNAIRR